MNAQFLLHVFDRESELLDTLLRYHPRLGCLFYARDGAADTVDLPRAYVQFLKLSTDYVQHTVPALRAAGAALAVGDEEDRRWSALLLGYADGETDHVDGGGHQAWAHRDMVALGAPADLLDAAPHPAAVQYGRYFVDEAVQHPYAILGAKGVLEHLSIRSAADLVRGVTSRVPQGSCAIRFVDHHGVLDADHVHDGDRNLLDLRPRQEAKLRQILGGAYWTSGTYRALLYHLMSC